MLNNYRKLTVVLSIVYVCSEINAEDTDVTNGFTKYDKLEFWERSPRFDDARRAQKKPEKKSTRYPRRFQAVELSKDFDIMQSYNELSSNENFHKQGHKQENYNLLDNIENGVTSKNYVQSNNIKTRREGTSKFERSGPTDNLKTVTEHNLGVEHIHFKKISDAERMAKAREKFGHETNTNGLFNRNLDHLRDATAQPVNKKEKKTTLKLSATDRNLPTFTSSLKTTYWGESVKHSLNPYDLVPQMLRILHKNPKVNVTTEILGRTAEYRDVVLFKITEKKGETEVTFRTDPHKYIDEPPEKKIVFLVHGLTVMGIGSLACLIEEEWLQILLDYYLDHLDKFDIFLIPMANPDGFLTKGHLLVWNKNMSPQSNCKGVMLDRNFDVAWNNSHGLSSCSQAYPGPIPFSEVETRAVRDVFHYHGHKMIAYIHVHAGTYSAESFKGDAVLYPRGYTDVVTDDDKYIDIKAEVDEVIRNASFKVVSVTVDTLQHWYGKVTGTSVDYASTVYGIPMALEFVMQPYQSDKYEIVDEKKADYNALTEIWSRVIKVVFKHIAINNGFKDANLID